MKHLFAFVVLGLAFAPALSTSGQTLQVTSHSPGRNALAVPANTDVLVTFDQVPEVTSLSNIRVFSREHQGRRTMGPATLSGSTATLPLTGGNFRPGETVQVTVPATVYSGMNAAVPSVFQFTTAAGVGPGTFTPGSDPGTGTLPWNIGAADVDGDGDVDFLTANQGTNTVSVRFNNGSGIFSPPAVAAVGEVPVGNSPFAVTPADVDGDGDLDFLTANFSGNTVSVRFNNGSGVFSPPAVAANGEVRVGTAPYNVAAADVDGDGDLDLLTPNQGSHQVSIRLNDGSGVFSPPAIVSNGTVSVGLDPFGIVTGDVDNDGDMDFLTISRTNNTVSVRFNNGSGVFSPPAVAANGEVSVGNSPLGIVAADVDGDGDLDILTANFFNTTVSVRLNDGTGVFSLPAVAANREVNMGAPPRSVTAADIDGDGDLDLLTPIFANNTVSIRFNNGSGVFSSPAIAGHGSVRVGASPYHLAAVDVDGDRDLDLLVGNTSSNTVSVRLNQPLADLVVSTPENVSGNYNSVTVTGTGIATLTGPLSAVTTFVVQPGGILNSNCQPVIGSADFTLSAGATLYICDPAGLSSAPASGTIQTTGSRLFSTDASYIYNGTTTQLTGDQLPGQVRNLGTTNANNVRLTAAVRVAQALTVGSTGNLVLNNRNLTLLSDASGTALVVNSSTGVVTGSTATMQRAIVSTNLGPGYRHYATPVVNPAFSDLTTPNFSPLIVGGTYNNSVTPGSLSPFPNVYGYDEGRLRPVADGGSPATDFSEFDKGWFSPVTSFLQPGRGYTVNIAGTEKVDFNGVLNTGALNLGLARLNGTEGGWSLVGNPYPSPLDWTQVATSERSGLDAAMYVFESTSQYAGQYRAYVNGMGGGNPIIGSSQGFFVRVSAGQTSGLLSFRNTQRVTDYSRPATFRRGTADTRPQLRLTLEGASSLRDDAYLYFETGATPAADALYDAVKLPNSTGLNLATVANTGQPLAVDGRPVPGPTPFLIPLQVDVPAAGTYAFRVGTLVNFSPGTTVWLRDGLRNTRTPLSATTHYPFALTSTSAPGRFSLEVGARAATATSQETLAAQIWVYPNPSHRAFTLALPVLPGQQSGVEATLHNALGQVVRQQVVAPTAGRVAFDVTGLATGVYVLQVRLAGEVVTKRVVVE